MKNNNKTYGYELIQKMKQDIDKLKKDTFTIPCLVKIVLSLAGIIIFAFVVRTFIPSRSPETINYNIIVNKANENCKSEIKTEMAEALVKVEERAVNAYNDKFSALLTILTIFGIAWPVIIALLQFKFNENELKKIDKAKNNAEDAVNKVKISLQEINALRENITEIEQGLSQTAAHIFHVLYENFLVLATDLEEKVRDIKEGVENELDDTIKNKLIAIKDRYYLLAIYCILSQAIYQPKALHEQLFTDLILRLSDIKSEEAILYYPYCIGAAYKLLHKKEPHPIAKSVIEILEKKQESLK